MTEGPFGLTFENYKSFGEGLTGFELVAPVNVIIGRNNSGKSALLDVIEWACKPTNFPHHLWNDGKAPRVVLRSTLSESVVSQVFRKDTSGGPIHGNHWNAAQELVGAQIEVAIETNGRTSLFNLHSKLEDRLIVRGQNLTKYYNGLGEGVENPLSGKIFRKLSAERDIVPETTSTSLQIGNNGAGFTNTIAECLNRFEHPTRLVSEAMLAALNEIFAPDSMFNSISVQQYSNGTWEVFLTEHSKGTIALSHSGSGLKTILLVISFFLLIPYIQKKSLSNFVFAFEELENNLHPALQRRLLRYVIENAKKEKAIVFLTTHSNVVIDMFSHDRDAQIVHVTHLNGSSKARRAQTYVENRGVLDDLDVRASDLLQSNVVVWLEGPSDQLYLNRWIHLFSDGKLAEGAHYQCVFYGGRLLSHLSASDPDVDPDETVKILHVNKNAILLIDSDKENEESPINATKQRLISEMQEFGGLAWVTAGREIENYLPLSTIQTQFPAADTPLGKFEDISEYLERLEPGAGKKFERKKILFAESAIPTITRESHWMKLLI